MPLSEAAVCRICVKKSLLCLFRNKRQIWFWSECLLCVCTGGTAERKTVKITARGSSCIPATLPATLPSSPPMRSGWRRPISWALPTLMSPPWTSWMLVSKWQLKFYVLSFTPQGYSTLTLVVTLSSPPSLVCLHISCIWLTHFSQWRRFILIVCSFQPTAGTALWIQAATLKDKVFCFKKIRDPADASRVIWTSQVNEKSSLSCYEQQQKSCTLFSSSDVTLLLNATQHAVFTVRDLASSPSIHPHCTLRNR